MTDLTQEQNERQQEQLVFLKIVHAIHEKLLDYIDYQQMRHLEDDYEQKKSYLLQVISTMLKQEKIEGADAENPEMMQAVIDEVLGFGPLEQLLRDAKVTDIFVNSPTKIFIEKKGRVDRTHVRFVDEEHVYRLVQRIASKSGRHLDLGTPYLDAHLPDGSRLHAIIPPCAIEGTKLSIRKFLFNKLSVEALVEGGSMTMEMAKFLRFAVKARFNIVICGGTGSGKTTLLNTLLDAIRGGERVITIEDTPELEPTHGHIIRLITRTPNAEGKGGVSQEDLMINALRMRPDRVVLGELRGAEAFNLLHAMNTGQDGSMVTLHASGTEEVLARLLNMILMAKYSLSVESVRQQIAGALDIVVYIARLVDGSRRLMTIAQISRDQKGDIHVNNLFQYRVDKINEHELIGEHEKITHPLPNRLKNKLMVSGLLNEYLDIFPDLKGKI